ncbi:MAG: nucleotidyl transferase AbiEii/AbiGii toxin family protein [Terriglobales bacterium]
MTLAEIRKIAIISMFSDDWLMEKLVLKGGNALSLVYGISARTSLDLDFSIDGDFPEVREAHDRIEAALVRRFAAAGFTVFDFKFEQKPKLRGPDEAPRWGGYVAKFKIVETARFADLRTKIDELRKYAELTGPHQERVFSIEFSKYEYCEGKREQELGDFTIYVYSQPMIAAEKLRAICQQMEEYRPRSYKTARARDFFDIYTIDNTDKIDWTSSEIHQLVSNMFAAKDVPLRLLGNVSAYREFHQRDWAAVRDSVAGAINEFDFYFNYVCTIIERLKTLWNK